MSIFYILNVMKAKLIDRKYKQNCAEIERILLLLIEKLDDPDFSRETEQLYDLIKSLEKPFMFVVIGEVKSGKSSFINSLIGEDICAVDADICTDKVHLVEYSEEYKSEIVDTYLEIKSIPSPILKEISIVDTPGTDSIVSEHEKITRRFAPNSNIIFFVFPVLNPHHSSSWEMLNIMKDQWSRNIIFIAAQADRCTPIELETGLKKIRHYARERGIEEPVIFPLSSKLEKEGQYESSGFAEVRDFISDTTRGGKHMITKIFDRIEIANIHLSEIEDKIEKRKAILIKDIALRDNITRKYEHGLDNSIKEIEKILDRMNFVFERTSGEYLNRLRKTLSAGNILKQAVPLPRFKHSKNRVDRKFLEEILTSMNEELKKNLSSEAADNAAFFIDGIKFRFSEIIREVEKARSLYNDETGNEALDNFINRREEILKTILEDLTAMSTDIQLLANLEKHNPDIGDTVLKGGVIAAAGALLSLIAQGAVFDATGGALSAVGILGAGGIILFKRSRMIREFRKSIEEMNREFSIELKNRFVNKMNLIFDDIYRQFERIDQHISYESELIKNASSELQRTRLDFQKIQSEI